jgi:hypothetical protein
LIVPTNFYELLIKEHENSNAVQCFTNRRVNYIDEKSSLEIFRGQRIDSIISNPRNFKVGTPGAPGGSISVSRDLFLKCGGFDSHFFWSYSIEDKFFWSKIEKYERVKGMNNPPIELFHLWHPPGWGKNPYERFEQRIYHSFESENNWEDYIRKSIDLYNKTINHIVKR